jgi:uncharacterized protein YodC (DUF2158 family)
MTGHGLATIMVYQVFSRKLSKMSDSLDELVPDQVKKKFPKGSKVRLKTGTLELTVVGYRVTAATLVSQVSLTIIQKYGLTPLEKPPADVQVSVVCVWESGTKFERDAFELESLIPLDSQTD